MKKLFLCHQNLQKRFFFEIFCFFFGVISLFYKSFIVFCNNEDEWIFVNVDHLFQQTKVLFKECEAFCTKETCKTMSNGKKYNFLWFDEKTKTTIDLCAVQYGKTNFQLFCFSIEQ